MTEETKPDVFTELKRVVERYRHQHNSKLADAIGKPRECFCRICVAAKHALGCLKPETKIETL